MNLLVNGLGNIGTTLVNALLRYRDDIGFSTLYGLKNTPKEWEAGHYDLLRGLGLTMITRDDLADIAGDIDYAFDTTANGGACANKSAYLSWTRLAGAAAQGCEELYGRPYMVGCSRAKEVDPSAGDTGPELRTVVSCNTHGILALLSYLSGNAVDTIESADFVVVRRSEDLGNHQRHVASNVVARHRGAFGTHHAEDANRVLALAGVGLRVSSSDITTPEQLMHSVRFRVEFKDDRARVPPEDSYVAETHCFDANRVFDLGRRYGSQGRLYNHAIVVSNNMLWRDTAVQGWAFVPQEGNTIISTIASMLETLRHPARADVLKKIRAELTRPFY